MPTNLSQQHRRPGRPASLQHFGIRFEPIYAAASRCAGVRPSQSSVTIDEGQLTARFGAWTVHTPIDNIASVERTGPYQWFKVMGPPHLSVRDRGLTFAGTSREGVCIRFHTPVRGIDPAGFVRHPALTVTVDDPDAFVDVLRDQLDNGTDELDDALQEIDEEEHDELEGLTAAELREIARADGIRGASRLKKTELIEAIEQTEQGS